MEVLGPYVLEQRIARGGMGEIYRASLVRDGGFQRTVAVKRILPHLSDDATFVRMFEVEARLTALLSHPNIVHTYDFGRDDGAAWLAMEFVDGVDLRRLLEACDAQSESLPLGLALHIVEQCARGLHYAHTLVGADGPLHIIHRDVSPQNILVSVQGETKLTDFGLAKALAADPGSMSGMLKGKLGYMAPEQIRAEPLTPKTDVFGLGAVLFELVSRRRLYPSDVGMAALVARVTHVDVQPLSETEAPASVRAIVARCLAVDPDNRYANASDLADAIAGVRRTLGLSEDSAALGEFVAGLRPRKAAEPSAVVTDGTVAAGRPAAGVPAGTVVAARPAASTGRNETVAVPRLLSRPDLDPRPPEATLPSLTGAIGDPSRAGEGELAESISVTPSGHSEAAGSRAGWPMALVLLVAVGGAALYALWPPNTEPRTPRDRNASSAPATVGALEAPPPITPRATMRRAERRARRLPEFSLAVTPAPHRTGTITVETHGAENPRCHAWSALREEQRELRCGAPEALPVGPWRLLVTSQGNELAREVVLAAGEASTVRFEFKVAPGPCQLSVSSTPSGGTLVLDGTEVPGVTPLEVSISPGQHTARVEKRGRQAVERTLTCASEPLTLDVPLEAPRFRVSVGSRARSLGFGASHAWPIQRSDGGKATLRVKMTSKGAALSIDGTPWARVSVDGRVRGPTPLRGVTVPIGRRARVVLKREGRRVGRAVVSVQRVPSP